MAGEWIKMRTSLLTNPRVNGIARIIEQSTAVGRVLSTGFNGSLREIVTRNVTRHVTVSSLLIIWGAANEHTKDGIFRNADLSDIDDMVGIPGFGAAMVEVGWAEFDESSNCVMLPNFAEYNMTGDERAAGAKTGAQRQKEYRDRKKSQGETNDGDDSDVTRNRREEKRIEEKIIDKSTDSGTAKGRGTRGTRLPADWKPSPDDVEYCKTERPELLPSKVAQNFYDYWIAKSGKDATKVNWSATWRSWVRKERTENAPRHRPGGGVAPSAQLALDATRHANTEAAKQLLFGGKTQEDGRTFDE